MVGERQILSVAFIPAPAHTETTTEVYMFHNTKRNLVKVRF